MLIIPINPVPSQVLNVQLADQACTIRIYQKFYGIYLDLLVSDVLIIGGVKCEDRNRIVRDIYLGFLGDLTFIDNQGLSDPTFTGLGSRFSLAYLTVADLLIADAELELAITVAVNALPVPVPTALKIEKVHLRIEDELRTSTAIADLRTIPLRPPNNNRTAQLQTQYNAQAGAGP